MPKKAPPLPAPLAELSGPPTLVPTQTQEPVDDSVSNADLAIELADVMLSMGLASGAAQTLEEHIRQHPRQALVHWLKLLDVYRRSGQQTDYEAAAKELQQHFNIAAPDWQAVMDPAIRAPSLEHYLHISHRIQELWPRKSCTEYLTRLLEDNRGGTRTGFPQQVIEEILVLLAILRG